MNDESGAYTVSVPTDIQADEHAVGRSTEVPHNLAIAYRREIDGLRAVAVLPVILFHAGIRWFSGGFVGVDIFFVISGFLITSIILREMEQGKFSILRFYERRAKRILPALCVVMLCSLFAAWIIALPTELVRFGQGLMAVATFSSNIFFTATLNYFTPAAELQPLLHTWSLAVEEQYYVFFPLFVMCFLRFGKQWMLWLTVLVAIVSVFISEWGWTTYPDATFYLLPSRAWELLSGSILAFIPASTAEALRKSGRLSGIYAIVGLGLLVAAILDFHLSVRFPGIFKLLPVLGAALIIAFADESNFAGSVLASRPLVGLGLISYSAYLWHYPVFAFMRLDDHWVQSRRVIALLVFLTLALAWLSWRFVESYPRRAQLSQRTVFIWAAASLVMLFGVGYTLSLGHGFPSRVTSSFRNSTPQNQAFIRELLRWENGDNDNRLCRDAIEIDGLASCEVGVTTKASVDVILWGDSLAGALAYGMNSQLLTQGRKGLVLISSGCPPILTLSRPGVGGCSAITHQRALQIIDSAPGAKTVFLLGNLFGGSSDSDCLLDGQRCTWAAATANIAKVSRGLATTGRKLVVVQQGPFFPEAAYRFYLRDRLKSKQDELQIRRVDYENFIKNLRSFAHVADYLDTTEFFCGKESCSARHDGVLFFYDEDHYTFAGSTAFAAYIFRRTGECGFCKQTPLVAGQVR